MRITKVSKLSLYIAQKSAPIIKSLFKFCYIERNDKIDQLIF